MPQVLGERVKIYLPPSNWHTVGTNTYCVRIIISQVEVQVEQVGSAGSVIVLSPSLRLGGGDDLANVLHGEGALLDLVQRLHAPPTAIARSRKLNYE